MKIRLLVFVAMLLPATSLFAQFTQTTVRPVAGLKFGANGSWFMYEEDIDKSFRTGAVGGVFVRFDAGPAWSLQLEALYSMEGAKSEGREFGLMDEIRIPETFAVLDYLKFPLLLRFGDERSSMSFITGPSVSLLIKGERVVRGGRGEPDQITRYDGFANDRVFAWIAGVAIKLSENMSLDARYSFGITPAFDASTADNDHDDRNQSISVMLEAGFR